MMCVCSTHTPREAAVLELTTPLHSFTSPRAEFVALGRQPACFTLLIFYYINCLVRMKPMHSRLVYTHLHSRLVYTHQGVWSVCCRIGCIDSVLIQSIMGSMSARPSSVPPDCEPLSQSHHRRPGQDGSHGWVWWEHIDCLRPTDRPRESRFDSIPSQVDWCRLDLM